MHSICSKCLTMANAPTASQTSSCAPVCHTAVAYLLLLDLGVNFIRYFVSEPWHKSCLWSGSKQLNGIRQAVSSFLMNLGSAHDKYLSAEDPAITLKVTWLIDIVSDNFSPASCRLGCRQGCS